MNLSSAMVFSTIMNHLHLFNYATQKHVEQLYRATLIFCQMLANKSSKCPVTSATTNNSSSTLSKNLTTVIGSVSIHHPKYLVSSYLQSQIKHSMRKKDLTKPHSIVQNTKFHYVDAVIVYIC